MFSGVPNPPLQSAKSSPCAAQNRLHLKRQPNGTSPSSQIQKPPLPFQILDMTRRGLGFFDLDVVTIEANLIDGNRIIGNPAFLGLPGLDVERSGVPRAGDDVAVQLTFH